MTPKNILITGSSRGIGLELVNQLARLDPSPKLILAACRNLETAQELIGLAKLYTCVKVIQMDLESEGSIQSAFKETTNLVGSSGLNVLINNAAINMRQDSISKITEEDLLKTFKVNVVGPAVVTKIFLPLLRLAASTHNSDMSWSRAAIINMSSRLGSVGGNVTGGSYQYRESKAALNQLTKNLSIELTPHGVLATCIHPGRVRTDMGGPKAEIEAEESVQRMIKVLEKLNHESAGKLISNNGEILQW